MQNAPPSLTPEQLAQHPLLAMLLSVLSLVLFAFLAATITSWILLGLRLWRGLPILPSTPWSPRAWGLSDVVIVVVLVFGCQFLLAGIGVRLFEVPAEQLQENRLPVELTALISFGNVLAVALSVMWLVKRYQVSLAHLGFQRTGALRQLGIGLLAAVAALPIVYLLMAAVTLGLRTEYQHPLLDEMKRSATLTSYLLGAITAVLFAPLAEEFLFRIVIQGWLQSWSGRPLAQIVLGTTAKLDESVATTPISEADNQETAHYDSNEREAAVASSQSVPLASPPQSDPPEHLHPTSEPLTYTPPLWPSLVTGVLFGLAHWGYGLSFIPLIVLGILLGLLYRATHSIWPCLVVHMILNASSMLGLGLGILIQRASE